MNTKLFSAVTGFASLCATAQASPITALDSRDKFTFNAHEEGQEPGQMPQQPQQPQEPQQPGQDQPTQPKNYFEQIGDWIETGSNATLKDVQGAWTGRCFEKVAPTVANSALLLSHQKDEVGPGFESATYLGQMVSYVGGADYFDEYDIDADTAGAQDVFLGIIADKKYTPVSTESGTLQWTMDFEPNGRIDMEYSASLSRDFIVIEGVNLINGNIIWSNSLRKNVHDVKPGVWSRCYYFKQL